MDYVRYTDRTREYYAGAGFAEPYVWAHDDSSPFTRLGKPLSECRVTLITTAGFELEPEGGFSEAELAELRRGGSNVGSYDLEVFPVPSDTPEERIAYVAANHDRAQSDMSDPNAYFPLTRLREFRDAGVLGSLAEHFYRLRENYSQRKTLETDAPEVARRCLAEGVDVALMVPV
ncbi:MAG: hypothetical protein IIA41_14850 [SAR324 cluster bacterium]|nr:hypothetical protein [SAR324 cluster bacterium]